MDRKLVATPTKTRNIVVELEGEGSIGGDGPDRWLCGNCGLILADGQGPGVIAISGSYNIHCNGCGHYNDVEDGGQAMLKRAVA